MSSKKRPISAVIALVAIAVVAALVLIALGPGQASEPQSLARKMTIDSSYPSVHSWHEQIGAPWNSTGRNSHISYVANCDHLQILGSLSVWNLTSEAIANFHSWNLTSNYHNLTIGDESSINIEVDGLAYRSIVDIHFIRGNVTAGLHCEIYHLEEDLEAVEAGIEESLMLALAQDLKILREQAAIQ